MTDTDTLIARLAAEARPAPPLPHPLRRAALWLLAATGIVALLALQHGLRPDLDAQLRSAAFATHLAASLATGVLATLGCLLAARPDRSRLWLLLPLPALAAWLSGLGYGCLTAWVDYRPGQFQPGEALRCLATLLLVSLPLAAVLFAMLRHAARLRPWPILLCAGVAVGATAASALALLHPFDASLLVLAWNLGAAAVIAAIAAAAGRGAMRWFARLLAA